MTEEANGETPQEWVDRLVREGLVVKTIRMRNERRPLYIATEHATEQELKAQRRSKQ
jgi:hypothetical protein